MNTRHPYTSRDGLMPTTDTSQQNAPTQAGYPSQEQNARNDRAGHRFVTSVVANMPPSGIRRFFDLISQTKGVISLGVGEPDFATPWHIREAAVYSLERGRTTYTANAGLPELRVELARMLASERGLVYDPETELVVTVGVSEALDLALRATLRPGDEVLIPEPCFVSYGPCTTFAGGQPVFIHLDSSNQFQINEDVLRSAIGPRTRAILICSPNNPTGSVLRRSSLEAIARVANEYDLLVISDEIYGEMVYDIDHLSIARLPGMQERTLLLDGFSKSYAMTGWRIGYAAGPAAVIGAMTKIHQYTIMSAPTAGQYAAIEALRSGHSERERMMRSYEQRRRLILAGFERLGLECYPPEGAFYAFPSVKATGLDDVTFAERLLLEEKVAVVPGSAFGAGGAGHIRCAYAAPVSQLVEALDRMERFLRRLNYSGPMQTT